MATTVEKTLGSDWIAVAAGAGFADVTPLDDTIRWATTAGPAPGAIEGHIIHKDVERNFDLPAGETLYLRGRGRAAVTAANPL